MEELPQLVGGEANDSHRSELCSPLPTGLHHRLRKLVPEMVEQPILVLEDLVVHPGLQLARSVAQALPRELHVLLYKAL